jgi:hypothetical protein
MVRRRIGKGGNYSVIVKTDGFSDSYTLDTMYKLYREESKGDFRYFQDPFFAGREALKRAYVAADGKQP